MQKYKLSLFIFRRDLRIEDNTALLKALEQSEKVLPIFIFTPEQIQKNPYKSNRLIQFMVESLLDIPIPVHFFFGKNKKVIKDLLQEIKDIEAVYINADYTPYSRARDATIKKVCIEESVNFHSFEDSLLHPVESILTQTNTPYKKFTPYYNTASSRKVRDPIPNTHPIKKYFSKKIKGSLEKEELNTFYTKEKTNAVKGGRTHALAILKNISSFEEYPEKRNDLGYSTTHLSAYNKFGCVSIREVYKAFRSLPFPDLCKQLYWRDFYYMVVYYHPEVLKQKNFNGSYDRVEWITWETATPSQKKMFERWCEGRTGFPMVDAGMRELNETGFMHNRARLIVASFLTKLMMWHWKDGERYFAEKLIDYDPAQNNGNWQWCAGSGVDAQPYYRIFNPWTQFSTHDKKGEYVRKWLPECKDIPLKDLLKWGEVYSSYKSSGYPKPMLDYTKKRQECLEKLSSAFSKE